MKGKLWPVGIMALLLALSACGQVGASPTLAAEGAAPARGGGGGWVSPTGQFTEGLVVVGTGTASAEPEVAQVTFGVEIRGDDPAAIVDEAAQKIERAIAAARQLEVAEEDIRTTSYNLWVETLYDPDKGVPTGEVVYHLSHYAQVTLHAPDQVGDLLAAVVAAGANTISGVSFTVEDPEALEEQARQQALADAQARAQGMAQALDITLGKPVLVMEVGGGYLDATLGRGGGGALVEMEVAAPSISPGAFSISISVQVVYEIR